MRCLPYTENSTENGELWRPVGGEYEKTLDHGIASCVSVDLFHFLGGGAGLMA